MMRANSKLAYQSREAKCREKSGLGHKILRSICEEVRDVAREHMRRVTGKPFVAAPSEINGTRSIKTG